MYKKIYVDQIAEIDDLDEFLDAIKNNIDSFYELDMLIDKIIDTPNRQDHLLSLKAINLYGDDLEELRLKSLEFLCQGNDFCLVYLTKDIPLKDVILHGFVPIKLSLANLLRMEHPDCPDENFAFMNYEQLGEFRRVRGFQMFTESYAKSLINVKKSTSFLKWTYPNLLYSTQRVKTTMSMYRMPFSKDSLDDYSSLLLTEGITKGKYYVPVTRYSESPETGLYHTEKKEGMCGTFFYLEPESTIYLTGESFLVSQTKCSALNYILEHHSLPDELITVANKKITKYMHKNTYNIVWERDELKSDLLYTPVELHEEIEYGDEDEVKSMVQYPLYTGELLDLYAAEDLFDQILCRCAREVGIKIVVLTRMVGAKQIVTEVLDTRDRAGCFSNLVYARLR